MHVRSARRQGRVRGRPVHVDGPPSRAVHVQLRGMRRVWPIPPDRWVLRLAGLGWGAGRVVSH